MADQRYNAQAGVEVDLSDLENVGNRAQAILDSQKPAEVPLRSRINIDDRDAKKRLRGVNDDIKDIDKELGKDKELEVETSRARESLETIATLLGSIVSMAAGVVVTLNARQAREELEGLADRAQSIKEKMFSPGHTIISTITGTAVGAWTVGQAMGRSTQEMSMAAAIRLSNETSAKKGLAPEQIKAGQLELGMAKERLFLAREELKELKKKKLEIDISNKQEVAAYKLKVMEAEKAVTAGIADQLSAEKTLRPREPVHLDEGNIAKIVDKTYKAFPAITKGEAMMGVQRAAMMGFDEKMIERMLQATSDLTSAMGGSKTWSEGMEAMFDALNGDMMRLQEFAIANDPTQFRTWLIRDLGMRPEDTGIASTGQIIDEKKFGDALLKYIETFRAGFTESYLESPTGQWETLKTKLLEVGVAIGMKVVPLLTKFLKAINAIPDPVFNAIAGILGIGGAIWIILAPILKLAFLWALLAKGASLLAGALGPVGTVLGHLIKFLFGFGDFGVLANGAKLAARGIGLLTGGFSGLFSVLAPLVGMVITSAAAFQAIFDVMNGGWGDNFLFKAVQKVIKKVQGFVPDWLPGGKGDNPLWEQADWYAGMVGGPVGGPTVGQSQKSDVQAIEKYMATLTAQLESGAITKEQFEKDSAWAQDQLKRIATDEYKWMTDKASQDAAYYDSSVVTDWKQQVSEASARRYGGSIPQHEGIGPGGSLTESLDALTVELDALVKELEAGNGSMTVTDQTTGGVLFSQQSPSGY